MLYKDKKSFKVIITLIQFCLGNESNMARDTLLWDFSYLFTIMHLYLSGLFQINTQEEQVDLEGMYIFICMYMDRGKVHTISKGILYGSMSDVKWFSVFEVCTANS